MAEISSLNGYDLKDKVAREQISYLQTSFDSHNHDSSYETKTDASAKLAEAKQYADSSSAAVKNDLLNGAGEAYDTLKELGELIDENSDAITVLNDVAAGKADKEHTHSWNELEDKPFYGENNVVEWDGIPDESDSRINVTMSDSDYMPIVHSSGVLIKVSDIVISPEEAFGGVVTVHTAVAEEFGYVDYGRPTVWVIEDNTDEFLVNNETMWAYREHLACVLKPVNGVETGLYFIRIEGGGGVTTSFKWGDLKQLDEKYIPDTIARKPEVDEALAGKADASHTHAISEVTELQATLDSMQSEIDANESSISIAQTKLATIEEGAQVNVQPDWNENDPTADGYVKNRPFYIDGFVETTFIDETTIEFSENEDGIFVPDPMVEFEAGQTYNVIWNGASYTCVALPIEENGISFAFVGNAAMLGGADTGEPFIIAVLAAEGVGMAVDLTGASTCTFSVSSVSETVKKIDAKYLPDEVATKLDVFGSGGNITWDGDTTGLYQPSPDTPIYKVSDYAPSVKDVIGQTMSITLVNGIVNSAQITEDSIQDELVMYNIGEAIIVVLQDIESNGMMIPVGTYFFASDGYWVSELTLPQIGGHSHPSLEKEISSVEEAISSHTDKTDNPHGVTAEQVGAYTKVEIDSEISAINSAIDGKATKATTLSGYGITNAYTKSEVDSALSGKADVSDIPTVPTKVSAFENDANYLTAVPSEYVTETELSDKGYATTTYVDTAEADANEYTDNAIANLLNNDTAAVDSIMELASAMEDNADAIEALRDIAGTKAAASDLTAHAGNKSNPHGVTAAQVGAYTKAEIDSKVSALNTTIDGKAAKATTLSGYGITNAYTKSDVDSALNKYMKNEDPTGTGDLSMNRKEGTSLGGYSVAIGHNNTATGFASYAEGEDNVASGYIAHAEGRKTTASGDYSHAEGNSTTASGYYSHAEGRSTTASGRASHAEGQNTVASGDYQHVQGIYNIEDAEGKYSHIIGNGTVGYPSNAHTLDWDGNAWYQGTIKLGGTSYADASEVALKSDVEGIVTSVDDKIAAIDFSPYQTVSNATSQHDELKTYVDNAATAVKNDLLNGAGSAYDTLKELGDLIDDNTDAISALESVASNKMDKSNPTGTGSLSLNRKVSTDIGDYSVAEGYNNVASGMASHAEGWQTTASGNHSHTEGYETTASGSSDHAEGYGSFASGSYSHAEGRETVASGCSSHAEGGFTTASELYSHAEGQNTIASGQASHAEGIHTTASAYASHAEGAYTIASSKYQHVQGVYNIEDADRTYAHIVGNGSNGDPSNAHTLDWDGNAWYAGTIRVGGTSYDDASEVALKSDLDSIGIISDEEIDAIFASI